MNAFYHKSVADGINTLSEEEAKHCIQVFRHKVGDEILVLDGEGGKYRSMITAISKRSCSFEIINSIHAPSKPFRIHLAIAPTKNLDRMEWLVEKLTEIGVDEITLMQTENSERRKIRIERLEKKALSALKQSKNPFLPKINDLTKANNLLSHSDSSKRLIAHVSAKHAYIDKEITPKEDVLILIGPEGDFSASEIELALKNGFTPVSLGSNTLRTETAGFVACCFINLVNKY